LVVNRERLTEEAAKRGIEVVALPVNTIGEISDTADALASLPIDAIVQVGSNLTTSGFAAIARSARRERVPLFGALSSDADNGAALVVARDYYDGGVRAGHLAARVLRGEAPGGIPFEPLRTSKILVNPPAARAMGFTLPEPIVARASRVIGAK
jgi:putative ABC transport system substrate-binding protein